MEPVLPSKPKKPAHTPGPWIFWSDAIYAAKPTTTVEPAVLSDHRGHICDLEFDDEVISDREREANGRLIAEAPRVREQHDELLAAAKTAHAELVRLCAMGHNQKNPVSAKRRSDVLAGLRAAIAKAEGGGQ